MGAAYFGAFLLILGAKLALIHYAGNSTPFWDEWDGDAADVIQPYVSGTLGFADLFQAHNEHRIVFTRLETLAIFNISGFWDVVLQMIINAVFHAATVLAATAALARVLDRGRALVAIAACAVVFAIPFGCESTLVGFNVQFYLLTAFSFASLYCLAPARSWSPRWWLGTLFAVASFLSMASGALTLAGPIGLYLLQIANGRRAGFREWLGIGVHVAIVLVLVGLTPTIPGSEATHAHSLGMFLAALATIASWPWKTALPGAVVYLPAVAFLVRTLKERPEASDARWLNVATLGWLAAQYAAFAFGRATGPVSSRYLDVFLVGVMMSLVSALWLLAQRAGEMRSRRRIAVAVMTWLAIVGVGLARTAIADLPGQVEVRRDTATIETSNVRGYLATGDFSYLDNKPFLSIPYPSAERLRDLLDVPAIRSALPPELLSQPPRVDAVQSLKEALLRFWGLFVGAGSLLLAAAAARSVGAWRATLSPRFIAPGR
jgi:hypothetical protein